ncbi:flagellar assembly protein FliH [Bacillus tianshenii]|uniref:Flagellar assembly protein FliH n=1 Tax=Sutcliffiella tianshenii TaxID=1463404 RepID=A0ABS2NWD7_9BACI|nr:flagellar assembly protein FliH [Bacillus tianshenii]MBM7618987.1 flagellar assembly protein FliH [Bacillus tianshenii]
MSRLIKSSLFNIEETDRVSIKVAPIFPIQDDGQQAAVQRQSIEQINKIVQEAKDEAAKIMKATEKEKEKILCVIAQEKQVWEEEKQRLIDRASNEGYEQGYQAGKTEALSEYENLCLQAKHTVELSKSEHQKKLDSSIETIMSISIKVSEKILGYELERDVEAYMRMVQTALKEVKEKEEVKIYVSTHQYPLLIQNKQHLQNIINSQYDLLIYPEAELAPDGCWIDSSAGRMEISVQTQLTEIKDKLLQLVKPEANNDDSRRATARN